MNGENSSMVPRQPGIAAADFGITPGSPLSQADGLVGKNPYATPCTCGKSMVLIPLPWVHCPACHYTYKARKLSAPSRCPQCDFSFHQWRIRNNIHVAEAPFP